MFGSSIFQLQCRMQEVAPPLLIMPRGVMAPYSIQDFASSSPLAVAAAARSGTAHGEAERNGEAAGVTSL